MVDQVVPFLATARAKYKRYSSYVLGFRHFCEMRDGLLPVRRRAIWAAYKIGATSDSRAVKGAKVVGDTLGDYHPHNPKAIYEAVVKMAQAETKSPCFVGIGNWGGPDDPAGDMRYTSCYLSPYAMTMLDADELACVPHDKTYDGKHDEPRFLPVKMPHLLLAGCVSLAPAYNGNIPPCAVDWVANAVRSVAANRHMTTPRQMSYRWGGNMLSIDSDWIPKGIGSAEFSPESRIEGNQLIISTLAPKLDVEGLEKRLSKYDYFAGLAPEAPTSPELVHVVARVSKGGSLEELQSYIGTTRENYSMKHVSQFLNKEGDVDYDFRIEGPAQFLKRWVAWRTSIVVAAANYRADKLRAEIRKLQLLARACDALDEIFKIIKTSKSTDDTRNKTMALLKCTSEEATMVMAIAWPRLSKFEKADLLSKAEEHKRQVKIETGIVSKPIPRLESDVDAAVAALGKTMQITAAMRTNIPTKKRRAA